LPPGNKIDFYSFYYYFQPAANLFFFFKLFILTFQIHHFSEIKCIQNVEKEDAKSIVYTMLLPPPNIILKTFMINLKIKRCGSLALRVFPEELLT